MLAVLRFLLFALILVAVAYAIASVPGTIGGTVGAIRFETSMPVAIGLLLLALVVGAVLLRLLATVLRLPGRFGVARELRRRRRGEAALTASLLALASGETDNARRDATRARRLLGRTPQTLLASAEADRAAGRLDEAEQQYKALAGRKDTTFLGMRGLIGIALARGDTARASALFADADKARPGTRWIKAERLALAVRTEDWTTALALARGDDAARACFATAAALDETDPVRAGKLARDAHKLAPELPAAALASARALRTAGKEGRALATLRETWGRCPHPDLAAAALASVTDRLARVKAAGQFVAKAPATLEAQLLLGRLCLDAGMWGEARRHATEARNAPGGRERRVFALLADLAERDTSLSEPERRAAQAEALRDAAEADPPPVWRCLACQAEQVRWRPVCPHCQTTARIAWTASRPDALAPTRKALVLATPAAPLLLGGATGRARV